MSSEIKIMKLKAFLTLSLAASCVTACNVDLKSEDKSSNFAYDFDQNGCKTGRHEFGTMAEYCNALKNDPLNNYCAYSFRKADYEANCGTDWAFWPGFYEQ